jgi:predicted tellurium resistance membrane protein TerC
MTTPAKESKLRPLLVTVVVVGLLVSILGLFLLIGFKHSNAMLSMIGLLLVLPFGLLAIVQDRFPEAMFWPMFAVAQFAYVWIVVWAIGAIVNTVRGRKRK